MMEDAGKRDESAQTVMGMKIIWGVLTLTQILYVAAIEPMLLQRPLPAASDSPSRALYVVALLAAVGSIAFFKSQLSREALVARLRPAWNEPTLKSQAFAKIFLLHVICWAMNEAVAICGLFAVVQTHQFAVTMPFAFAGLLLSLMTFPRLGGAVTDAARAS